jgi:hypothetical protein
VHAAQGFNLGVPARIVVRHEHAIARFGYGLAIKRDYRAYGQVAEPFCFERKLDGASQVLKLSLTEIDRWPRHNQGFF